MVVGLLSFPLGAQTTTLNIVLEFNPVAWGGLVWTTDSSKFYFFTLLSDAPSQTVSYSFDVATNTLTELTDIPLPASLPARDLERFSGQELAPYISESPNQEWVAVGIMPPTPTPSTDADLSTPRYTPPEFPKLALLNRSSGRVIFTDQNIIVDALDWFQWSDDSTSFVKSKYMVSPVLFFYGSGYADNPPTDLIIENISTLAASDGETYSIWGYYDMSPDGKLVLLGGTGTQTHMQRVLLWDAETHTTTTLDGIGSQTVVTAAFAPSSLTRIRALAETGLIEYDMNAGTTTVLNEDINTERFSNIWSRFSPDGRYVALIASSSGIYLAEISD